MVNEFPLPILHYYCQDFQALLQGVPITTVHHPYHCILILRINTEHGQHGSYRAAPSKIPPSHREGPPTNAGCPECLDIETDGGYCFDNFA